MCYKCEVRSYFGDPKCNECMLKSASMKSASKNENEEPYYVTLAKFYGGLEL